MKHLWLKYCKVYINHDPMMTLTQFMATWVDHVFKWGKLLKCHLKGKASRKLANGQNIDYSENKEENGPRASSAPTLGLNTIIFQHVYWYMQQISGERLQDHWSSCLTNGLVHYYDLCLSIFILGVSGDFTSIQCNVIKVSYLGLYCLHMSPKKYQAYVN